MHVALIVERRYMEQAQPAGVAAELRRRTCEVSVVDPAATAVEVTRAGWFEGADICIARGRSQGVLSLLASAEAAGAIAVNTSQSTAAVRDKARMAAALASAGLPTPTTYLGTAASLAAEIPAAAYPVVAKPVLGDNCRGVHLVDDVAQLLDYPFGSDEALLAQPYVHGPGYDLKLYGIGDQVWAVRKRSPLSSNGARGGQAAEPAALTPRLRELALACRRLFGVELYGVDCLETADGPIVIEVNEFPNYTAIPDADQRLADYVIARTREVASR